MKKLIILFAILFTLLLTFSAASAFTTEKTIGEAYDWAIAKASEAWSVDADRSGQIWCVDLTHAYFDFLGVGMRGGNAYEYVEGTDGFTTITERSARVGDIAVWKAGKSTAGQYGHVAIVTGVDANGFNGVEIPGHNGRARETYWPYTKDLDGQGETLACFLRPDFRPAVVTLDPNGADKGEAMTQEVKIGSSLTLRNISEFKKKNYKLAYWSTSPDDTGDRYNIGDIITPQSDMTLYAIWVDGVAPTFTGSITCKIHSFNSFTITYSCTDNVGVSNVGVFVAPYHTDNANNKKAVTGTYNTSSKTATVKVNLDTLKYRDDRYTITLFAEDEAQNIGYKRLSNPLSTYIIDSSDKGIWKAKNNNTSIYASPTASGIYNSVNQVTRTVNAGTKFDILGSMSADGVEWLRIGATNEFVKKSDFTLTAISKLWKDITGFVAIFVSENVSAISDPNNIDCDGEYFASYGYKLPPATSGTDLDTDIEITEPVIVEEAIDFEITVKSGSYGYGVYLEKYIGVGGNVIIPETIDGLPVVWFGNIFENNTFIERITIPESVSCICSDAFRGCTGLTSITIPNNVTIIGNSAFSGCTGLTSIAIPNSVTSIRSYAFSGCTGLTSIAIPNSVTSIEFCAFAYCTGLTNITIPNSVKSIQGSAFMGCTSLTNISIPNSLTSISGFSGCTGLTSITIPNSVTSIGSSAFSGCTGLTSITIPNSVTSIGDSAFSGCTGLTSITIPNSVTSISMRAFSGCTGLTNITIPNGVGSIAYEAFSDCTSLTSIMMSNSVTSIGYAAFRNCTSLASITIPDNVTSIGAAAFCGCASLANITIPNGITNIGDKSFSGCTSLANVTIPTKVTKIGDYAFFGCTSLASITIPDNVTSIGFEAFINCSSLTNIAIPNGVNFINSMAFSGCSSLKEVSIPASVTTIGVGTFSRCSSLSKVTIHDGFTEIGDNAFARCTSLSSITIPKSVTCIEQCAFIYCTSLTDVYYAGTEDDWSRITIETDNTCLTSAHIHYSYTGPETTVASGVWGDNLTWALDNTGTLTVKGTGAVTGGYEEMGMVIYYVYTTAPWNDYKDQIVTVNICEGVTGMEGSAFCRCNNLKSINLPSTIKSLSRLDECAALEVWNVANGNTSYCSQDGVLFNAAKTSLIAYPPMRKGVYTIPTQTVAIGGNAFKNARYLTQITLGNQVTKIGQSAFSGCTALTTVKMPKNLTSISNSLFASCSGLKSITLPSGLTGIGSGAFKGCTSLTSIVIPSKVTRLGFIQGSQYWTETTSESDGGVFENCTALQSVELSEGLITIGDSAFKNCTSLSSLSLPNSITAVGENAFYECSCLERISVIGGVAPYQGIQAPGKSSAATGEQITESYIGISAYDIGKVFNKCTRLKSIEIPSGITSIASGAFSGCTALTSVTIPDSTTRFGGNLLAADSTATIYCYAHSYAYANAIEYGNKFSILAPGSTPDFTLPLALTTIEEEAFTGIAAKYICVSEKATQIASKAFADCEHLAYVYIPSTVSAIAADAFDGCEQFAIIGKSGSAAEKYARKYGYPFVTGK